MDIKAKMNDRFRDLQGGLFLKVAKADVGEGAGNFMKNGGDIMAWADMYFPDPAMPASVEKAMQEALAGGGPSHYVMPIGQFELREAIAKDTAERFGRPIDPSRNVIITPGSDSGLLYAMMPFIEPEDEILVPQPCYPSNFLNCKLLGGKAVPVPLYEEDNYQLRIEEMEQRLTEKTKMVLITHPGNPTTTVFRKGVVEELCRFIVKHDLILISDQAFQDIIFDGIEFVHPCMQPGMWERTLTVCSISKGIGLSGFRIGYVIADDAVMDVLYGGAVNVLGASNTLASIGATVAIADKAYLAQNRERMDRRRRLAYEILGSAPGVFMQMSESGILSWLNISRLGSSEEVAGRIMTDAKIMINQGEPYGELGAGHIRIVTGAFAKDEDAAIRFERMRDVFTKIAAEKHI